MIRLTAKRKKADKEVKTEAHKALALQASRESIILLKNKENILPLDKSKLKNILVCGPTAKSTSSSISRYGALKTDVVSGYRGIVEYLKDSNINITFTEGIPLKDANWPDSEVFDVDLVEEEKNKIAEAVEKAAANDAVVVFVGEDETMVGENLSRTSLDLPGHQKELVKALSKTNTPLIVVLINGHPLSINHSDRQADAILEAWFPGEFGGQAIAEVLFGDYNPGGKLPVTMLRSVGQIPFSFPYKPDSHRGQAKDGPNGTGESRVVTELYPFGFGLSYTSFEYSGLKLEGDISTTSGELSVSFQVKNTGERAGDVVPQLYVNDAVSSRTVYEWQLRGFKRIHLKKGESTSVSFKIQPKDLELIDDAKNYVVEPGVFNIAIGDSSQDF